MDSTSSHSKMSSEHMQEDGSCDDKFVPRIYVKF